MDCLTDWRGAKDVSATGMANQRGMNAGCFGSMKQLQRDAPQAEDRTLVHCACTWHAVDRAPTQGAEQHVATLPNTELQNHHQGHQNHPDNESLLGASYMCCSDCPRGYSNNPGRGYGGPGGGYKV